MVGCGAGSYSVGGGAMVGSRRNQVRRGWNCGANGGWWGDEGRPESQARKSAGVHGASRGFGEHLGSGVVDRPDEGFGGGKGDGGIHALSKAVEVDEVVAGKRAWSDDRDGEGGRGY